MKKKNFNYNIAILRAIFCIAVLLYHLNILKGGYLAVCSFFVLTGYFTSKSLDNSKSIISYYKKRLLKIYIPLIIVLFSTISIITLLKSNLFNLKPEITSVLFGYNNFWQIGANTDYFARHISSPFIHLWYISILLQIELIFPLIFLMLKKIGKKLSKLISFEIILSLTLICTIYFYKASFSNNIMNVYYNTFTRVFSYLFGALIYSVHMSFNKILIIFRRKYMHVIIYLLYLFSLIFMFIFIDSTSKYFALCMILTSFITLRLIEYSIVLHKEKISIHSKMFKFISDISYEIYLVQYPVIYFFEKIKMNYISKILFIILITIIISWINNFALKAFKKGKIRILKIIILIPVLMITLYGLYQYIIMKDHTKEINDLKKEHNKNELIMKQKQEEYLKKQKEEEKNLNEYIESLDITEEDLKNYISNLKVIGIGDSIMLDPIDTLYEEFPNGYFDAKISRSTCAGADVLNDILNKGITADLYVFNLGTNGYPNDTCKNKIMKYISDDTPVFWLNTTHPDYDNNNEELIKYANSHNNIHILDWENYIKEHPDYLYSDYTHLRPSAIKPYVEFIKNCIYNYYLEEHNKQKENSINEYKNKLEDKISFYGNQLLINSFDLLEKDYTDALFKADDDIDYSDLLSILKNDSKLNKKLVFIFDSSSKITIDNYKELAKMYPDNIIYVVTLNNKENDYDNIKIINVKLDKTDYLNDKIHLNDKGKQKLVDEIKEILKGD